MGNYFVPSNGVASWKNLLANPEKQWKPGYSAYELANCWEDAKNLPFCVEDVFKRSHIPLFHDVRILYGFPEYIVSLPGRGGGSKNDLYLLAKTGGELLTIMVEGKVSETFDEKVSVWLGDNPSKNSRNRLNYILDLLDLKEKDTTDIRYQLLHRTASTIKEAMEVNAKNALMLVHSFSEKGTGFNDYANFVHLFNLSPLNDAIVGPVCIKGINLYFGWVTNRNTNPKDYYYSLFKTDKARNLAKEIDNYIYKKSLYKDEVEDYHQRYNNGARTDCIGYISRRGSYKFATITSARKACFVLHLGKKLHSETAKKLQKDIDVLLGHVYKESDGVSLTPGEVYIRLEWVDNLDQITPFIDMAYEMRLQN